MGMLPGMSEMQGMFDKVDEGEMRRKEAIFLSMTPWERKHPDSIDLGRKQRIARGSGNQVSSVNDVLRSYDQMRKQMKQLSKLMQMSPKERNRALKDFQRADGRRGGFPGRG
jgi:signal recognition particle subunit SRP54